MKNHSAKGADEGSGIGKGAMEYYWRYPVTNRYWGLGWRGNSVPQNLHIIDIIRHEVPNRVLSHEKFRSLLGPADPRSRADARSRMSGIGTVPAELRYPLKGEDDEVIYIYTD
jgi:hypothetical protein